MEERKPSSESDTLWATDLGEDGQEPCVTFKYKVIQLVAELFPFVEASSQLVIDEVGAGSFNRVIGVTILPSKTRPESNTGRHSSKLLLISQPQEYVIRMPLDGRDELSRLSSETKFDIAILQVIGSRLAIPVPKVLECDLSANNALAKPFVVQTRLRGQSLQSLAETLNIRQMASAVEQVTKIIEKVAAFTTPAAGFISTENLNFPSTFHIQLMQYPIPTEEVAAMFPGSKNANEQTALPQTPFELLVDHCYRWRKYEESVYHYGNKSIWAQILTIVRTLNRRGWLGDRLHLVHDDLYPRNILAVIDSPDTVEITGIVDWDMSFFGPKFVALRPPYWAWMEDYAYERDEDNASIDPEEEHNMLLKIAFMEAASEDFFQFALSQEAILARKLFYILVGGLMSDERRAAAYELFREWSALYPADIIDNSSLL
ncbi:Nn.00g053760.m01.CDS01 [Neocucurbitaria sp. VM-36]